MATVTYNLRDGGVRQSVVGAFTADGAAQDLKLGFYPASIVVINETDVIIWTKLANQAAANCIKQVAAGTTTLDATSAILIAADGTVTLSAALCANGKAIKFFAHI